ncbi:MAG: SDR family oxidoreductase [Rikenellaceae bacterium]
MNNYNPFSLSGKKILVTGASSGIGRAIAIECSKMGATVIATARNEERLQETISEMVGEGHKYICADLSVDSAIDKIIASIDGKLQGVVQCAGYTMTKPFQFLSKEDMSDVMKVNYEAPVILTQSLLKKKKMEKGCSIVFVSSISGVYVSSIAGSIYSASKGALNGVMKGLAIELAAKSIRINSVNPGMIDTDIFRGIISDEQLAEDAKRYPLKRYGKPEEVAYGVVYLLSDASSWTTGSNLLIDGGYTLQ